MELGLEMDRTKIGGNEEVRESDMNLHLGIWAGN